MYARTKETYLLNETACSHHEACLYQFGVSGYAVEIVVGLKGSHRQTWDEQMYQCHAIRGWLLSPRRCGRRAAIIVS